MNVMRLSVLTMIVAAIVVQIVEAEDPATPELHSQRRDH